MNQMNYRATLIVAAMVAATGLAHADDKGGNKSNGGNASNGAVHAEVKAQNDSQGRGSVAAEGHVSVGDANKGGSVGVGVGGSTQNGGEQHATVTFDKNF